MDIEQLKQVIRETVIETFEELSSPIHIIVFFEWKDKALFDDLKPGKWMRSGMNDYLYRVEVPQSRIQKWQIHIARAKYINTPASELSWKQDGTNHDRKTFNSNKNELETAIRVARGVLNLPLLYKLEPHNKLISGRLALEEIGYLPKKCKVFVLIVNTKKGIRE